MSRRIDFMLTEAQLAELEQAINTSPYPEVRQRAIAVRMLPLGQHPEQVAQTVMVTSNTIYAWHKRWREHGIAGLRDGHRTGRPSKADQAYRGALRAALSLWEHRLLVIWLPKYSPFLNPIERFWLHFKQFAVANRLHRWLDDLNQTVAEVMTDQNTLDHPNRLRLLDKFRLVA